MADTMPEDPECTACGYSLKGIVSTTCPECGADVSDPAQRYPSLAPSPWSRTHPRWLLAGVWTVVHSPVKTLSACASRRRVTRRRAMAFALSVTILLIALWPIVKEVGQLLSYLISTRGGAPGDMVWQQLWRELARPFRWRTYCGWQAWSVARWWLLFALLALALPSEAPRKQRGRRLLLFAPWIALLEIGYLVGIWFVSASVVPEPNTLFAASEVPIAEILASPFWRVRVIPTLGVGLVFGRAVLGWRWPASVTLAIGLVPVALLLSVLWTILFMESGLLDLVYGW